MIVLHATFPIDPERREDALDLAEHLVEESNREDGVVDYRAAVDVQDENRIRFFEQYEDAAAVEAHEESDHFQRFEEALPELLAGEPDVRQFEVSDVTDVEL
ncbi:homolog to autoinducer-2-degrading protein lsrG [Halobacterium hubeiense]|uniref:Homolog to autoinducer-2-degrading protein lsrG n=1 Tax=Halobacterium hubeiense TaxID=1407499 RepID=A0A0U5H140_9EURY|nr:putative quinol monooxygenase [Halobacterium hubeiense]CQH54318.1 homolog to autoinducer-2-degrading protein lsrG [Halobacterium hubeiense]